jgi:pimeloyl-ACP methyl ester carboxylesterase
MAAVAPLDHQAPGLGRLLREGGSLLALRTLSLLPIKAPTKGVGEGRPVMVIPGFLATDWSTVILLGTLEAACYRAYGWGLGMNLGARRDLLERMEAQLERAARRGPVSLVGWSLGGLYARELAKKRPDKVARVITLGSPFSGDVRANNAWRLYELINDHKVDAPPIDVRVNEKPPVPTIALWSRKDGIVAPACARGEPHECDRTVELDCTHMGFMTADCALDAVLEALAA